MQINIKDIGLSVQSTATLSCEELERLNRHIALHDMLQAHSIAAAVPCNKAAAKRLMDAIVIASAGEYGVLIYHIDCPDVFDEGLGPPAAFVQGTKVEYPMVCELCETVMENNDTYREFVVICSNEVAFTSGELA